MASGLDLCLTLVVMNSFASLWYHQIKCNYPDKILLSVVPLNLAQHCPLYPVNIYRYSMWDLAISFLYFILFISTNNKNEPDHKLAEAEETSGTHII